MKELNITVNGKKHSVKIDESMRLIDLLREKLNLLGTKEGCGEGECGACSIIMDGEIVTSCLVMAFQAEGSNILTIEGLEQGNGVLHPIQQAFLDEGATQCGFCTPGMILSAKALLYKNPKPTREQIRKGISGNLCRCTGYNKIVDAIEKAAKLLEKGGK